MYLTKTTPYYIGTMQCVKKAPFLLLWSNDCGKTVYGFVRKVALQQCGHWMMGTARVEGKSICVSGSYGGEGLGLSERQLDLPLDAVQLPQELVDAWNTGGGWNGAGNEAPAMKAWALETFKEKLK